MRPLLRVALVALLVGCEASSHLAPDEPTTALDAGEAAQLCRFTVDLLADAGWACTGAAAPDNQVDFATCQAEPPWQGFADVGAWEACVNARDRDPCDTGDACAP